MCGKFIWVLVLGTLYFKFLCAFDLKTKRLSKLTRVSANFLSLAVFLPDLVWARYFTNIIVDKINGSKKVSAIWGSRNGFCHACHVTF